MGWPNRLVRPTSQRYSAFSFAAKGKQYSFSTLRASIDTHKDYTNIIDESKEHSLQDLNHPETRIQGETPKKRDYKESVSRESQTRSLRRHHKSRYYNYNLYRRDLGSCVHHLTNRTWKADFQILYTGTRDGESKNVIREKMNFKDMAISSASRERGEALLWHQSNRDRWAITALSLLLESPEHALQFLEVTNRFPYPPYYFVSNCFLYLRAFHYEMLTSTPKSKERFQRVLLNCLRPERWPPTGPSNIGLRLFFDFCDRNMASQTFSKILHSNIHISLDTKLQILSRFIRDQDIEQALQALQYATRDAQPRFLESDLPKRRCSSLLLLASRQDAHTMFSVWSKILETGIKPNQVMLNLFLRLSLQKGLYDLGHGVLDKMEDTGYTPDSITYLTLLDNASDNRNASQFDAVMRSMDPSMKHNKYIVSKLLHAFSSFSRQFDRSPKEYYDVYMQMVDIYSQSHDVRPLEDLHILPESQLKQQRESKSPPSSHALVIMIQAFLRTQTRTSTIMACFHQFCRLVREGHGVVAPLAEDDYVFNTFLQGLQFVGSKMDPCFEIVQFMLQPDAEIAITKSQETRLLQKTRPTTRTWTILMSILFYRHEPAAAWKVRGLMSQQGLSFAHVTWNVAIGGFAAMQMTEETILAVEGMIAEGYQPDDDTYHGIRRLQNHLTRRQILRLIEDASPATDTDISNGKHFY